MNQYEGSASSDIENQRSLAVVGRVIAVSSSYVSKTLNIPAIRTPLVPVQKV